MIQNALGKFSPVISVKLNRLKANRFLENSGAFRGKTSELKVEH